MQISKTEEKLYHWWIVKLTLTNRKCFAVFLSTIISFLQAYIHNVLEKRTLLTGPDWYTFAICFVTAIVFSILWTRGAKDRLIQKNSAVRDSLTKLHNRGYFEESLNKLQKQVTRELRQGQHSRLVLLFGDMNNFKKVNDSFGHLAGDTAICHAADIMRRAIRDDTENYLCRYGGDEFCAAMKFSNTENNYAILRRVARITYHIKRSMRRESCYFGQTRIALSMTIGVHFVDVEENIMSELSKADAKMYTKKETRKTRIIAKQALVASK